MTTDRERQKSGSAGNGNPASIQAISRIGGGQSCPQHYPGPPDPLGDPIPIRTVARMLGCSAWTVRQKHIPQGLPHFRSGPQGKLVFFRDQVIRWILACQQKGEM